MGDYFKPFRRLDLKVPIIKPLVAYDFETTNIPSRATDEMTIQPRFITFYTKEWKSSHRLSNYKDVRNIIDSIWDKLENNCRLTAYNANRFDLRIILQALLESDYICEPFVSKVSGLRGAIIRRKRKRTIWLDPIAMLGLSCTLADFQSTFAPAFPKGKLNFEQQEFNANNPRHVEYAERDSEALYHAIIQAEKTVIEIAKLPLQTTIGSLGIKTFQSQLPKIVSIPALNPEVYGIVRRILARGGLVIAKAFKGNLWTYDINQAYAHAMRKCRLPNGRPIPTRIFKRENVGFYCVRLHRSGKISTPFLMRETNSPYRLTESYGNGEQGWITTDEISFLEKYGWRVEIEHGYYFESDFNMEAFVSMLEAKRREYPKGHPVNLLCKNIGNNAYGKTLQEPTEWRYVMSLDPPKGAIHLNEDGPNGEPIRGMWLVPEERDTRRSYERPQIGAFITAFIRCMLYETIMQDEAHFIKCDTDSVSFTRPQNLTISSWRYGDWKLEEDGTYHIVIGKKVYYTASHTVCKGLRVRELNQEIFERWAEGEVPEQEQIQLQSWKKGGGPTWRVQKRKGTDAKSIRDSQSH